MVEKGKRKTGTRLGLYFGFVVIIVCLALFVFSVRNDSGFWAQMELKTVDLRFRARGIQKPDPNLVICAIDQESVDTIGRWPWPRAKLASLIDSLAASGPKVIAMDIAFPLPEANPLEAMMNLPLPAGWNEHRRNDFLASHDGDRILSRSFQNADNTVLGYFFLTTSTEASHLAGEDEEMRNKLAQPDRFLVVKEVKGGWKAGGMMRAFGVEPNISMLRNTATGAGFFNVNADADGIVRQARLIMRYGGHYYPSLALQSVSEFLDAPILKTPLLIHEYGLDWITLGERRLITDSGGNVLLNFHGPTGTIPHVKASDILKGEIPADFLQGKLVFVGATAVGIGDIVANPYGSQQYPGTEVQATAASNILQNSFLVRPTLAPVLELALILLLGLVVIGLTLRLGAVAGPLAVITLAALYLVILQILFTQKNIVLGMVFPTLTMGAVFISVYTSKMILEVRERKHIRNAFSRYLHPSVVDRIANSTEPVTLGGEERLITVLFSDIQGFTQVCAGTDAPKMLEHLNQYFNCMTDVVLQHEGLIDKYIGDALMAFWGAPEIQEDQVDRACRCALKMMEELDKLNRDMEDAGNPSFSIRIGISTGMAVVGNVGSKKHMDYTAIGDCVNLASRLEQAGKRHKGEIHVDDSIKEKSSEKFQFQHTGMEVLIGELGETKIYWLKNNT